MARMLGPLALLALLPLLSCAGCASWRHPVGADTGYVGYTPFPSDGGLFQGALQDLSYASLNDWNFRRVGW
jgi:hypothetical protein